MMNSKVKGIYIHIPFCSDICHYCDFAKVYYDNKLADTYLDALSVEYNSEEIVFSDITSIYIGGGTPSALNLEQLRKLFSIINVWQFKNLVEFTIEINSEHLTNEMVSLFVDNKINRVSIGVQSFNEDILETINRHHSIDTVVKSIAMLRKRNIIDISIDLMYGFHNQTYEIIANDLEIMNSLDINHVSVYSLILEEGCVFSNINYQINELETDFDIYINDLLINKYSFEQYEVSNYARNHNYSKHNLLYWSNQKYYGFGLGASGYIDDYRYYNTKSITKYNNNDYNRYIDKYINDVELLKDEIMLSFRMYNGVNLTQINEKYSIDFTKYFEHAIIKNINRVNIIDNSLYFSKEGKLFLNDLIIDFIEEIKE